MPIHRRVARLTGLALLLALAPATALAQSENDHGHADTESELTLERLFPEKSFFGPRARSIAFAPAGRYAAYLYRPYDERRHGSDLYIFDLETGTSRRVTSVSVLAPYQESTRKVREDRLEKLKRAGKKEAAPVTDDALTGDWSGHLKGIRLLGVPPEGLSVNLSLKLGEDGTVSGTMRTQISTATITKGRFDAESATLDCTLTDPESGLTATLNATITDDEMTGTVVAESIDGELELSATRTIAEESENGETDDGTEENDEKVEDDTDDRDKGDIVLEDDADDDKAPRYGGVGFFEWSPMEAELIFGSGGDLYRYEVESGEIERLTRTARPEFAVQYLPDGAGYMYLLDGALMRVRFGTHMIEQIDPKLPSNRTMRSYRISPDGRYLAFVATDGSSYWGSGTTVSLISYRNRFAQVRQVPRHMSDNDFPDFSWHHYLYDLEGHDTEEGNLGHLHEHKFTGPRDIVHDPEWSLQSDRVTFATYEQSSGIVRMFEARTPEPDDNEEADEASDEESEIDPARLVYQFFHHGGPNTPGMMNPQYLADGRRIGFVAELSGFRHLHILDPLYEQLDQVTRGRWELYPLRMSRDRQWLFALATREHPTRQDVYRIDLESGDMTLLSDKAGFYSAADVSEDGMQALALHADFGSPIELYAIDAEAGETSALTDSHPEEAHELTEPAPTYFTFENRHGQAIHGHMFKPDDWTAEDKRPLIIYVYGGPLGTRKMATRGAFRSDSYFFAYYMAKVHGYVTCTIDPRGASGYGGLFEKSNFEQVGRPQVEDLVDGARWFIENHGVDADRVGLHGWSFGGFQTQMCLYTEPDVFNCGIAGAGPTEWENYNSWYSTGTIGPSRTGKTDLDKFSLLPLAKNLKSRLLLVHGMEDANVLYQDTVRVYRELLKSGKETLVELFLDPTGGHGLGGDVKTIGRFRKYEEFFVRCLGPAVAHDPDEEADEEAEEEATEDE